MKTTRPAAIPAARIGAGRVAVHARRLRPACALLIGMAAAGGCEGDRSRVAPRSGPPTAAERGQSVHPEVAGVCAAAGAWWRSAIAGADSAQVTAVDTLLVPPFGEEAHAVCLVQVWLPHGMREGQPFRGGADDSVPRSLQRSAGEWRRLIGYDADGPDGSVAGYQRGQVRCTVAQRWDGGDDSDSTYVAEEWYRQELTCWAAPGGEGPSG